MTNKLILKIMHDMIWYFHGDVRRINHALKVYSFATLIASECPFDERNRLIIGITALLHDIGIKEAEQKFNSASGTYQEQEGPRVAGQILAPYHPDSELVKRVCYIIGNHHSYSKIDGLDFQILVEADFLVNIFEDSMNRESALKVQEKIFKTNAGIRLLENMYLE